MLDGAPMLF